MARRYELITELYECTRAAVTSPQEWQKFLATACRNYKLPFDEQLLLFAQRPDATAVLEIERWNRQFGRWVNRGATGIAVFDRNAPGRARLKYYFDISDTYPGRFARRVPLWQARPEYEAEIAEALENSFGELADKSSFVEVLLAAAKNAVEDNLPDYLSELKYYKENSLLEELDDFNLEVTYRNAVGNSAGYMLLVRCGIDPALYFTDDDFRGVIDFNTPQVLNALGVATGDIGQMCLSEIARTVTALERQAALNCTVAQLPEESYPITRNETKPQERRKGAIYMNGITYTMQDGYRLPDLLPPQEAEVTIGKYGLLRRKFLQKHRRVMFTNLLTSGRLTEHLLETEQTARNRVEQITEQMAQAEGVTEQMKATDQMKWVGLMNSIRQAAEETVLAELIYS